LKKGEESEEGDDVAGRERSSTASCSRGSVADRISFGDEKSRWEGGMIGAKGIGEDQEGEYEGDRERETESRDASIVEEEDEAAFNPGMI